MIAGFTGTQKGMTDEQKKVLEALLQHHLVKTFHHGDCIGADEEAHQTAYDLGLWVVLHPPTKKKKRAFCKGHATWVAKPYLERNKEIVSACQILFVTPDGFKEKIRSGTWATYRYAKKKKKKIVVIYPSGDFEYLIPKG